MNNELIKYKIIFNESTDALVLTNGKSGEIIDVNDACLSILGYTREEMLGRNYKMLFPHGGYAQLALSPNKIKMFDNVLPGKLIQKKDGSRLLMDLTITNIIDGENKYVLSCFRDATERVRMETALEEYTEKLKEMNTTKDKLFSIIAHDLNNPFVTLLGFVDIFKDDFVTLSDEEKLDFIGEIEKVAKSSHQLLQNLLTWSRAQLGSIEIKPKKFNLRNAVDASISVLKATAANKDISIVNNVEENISCFADQNGADVIFRNLIMNAVKFTNRGGQVEIGAEEEFGKVKIYVKDNGTGMDDKTVASLFKLENKISTLGTENEKGTGLGLILCEEFVHKNNGEIWCDSSLGTGTTIFFTLPIE